MLLVLQSSEYGMALNRVQNVLPVVHFSVLALLNPLNNTYILQYPTFY